MTKKVIAIEKVIDTFCEQISEMISFVEKNKKWAEERYEEGDGSEEYSVACRILCLEEGLEEMERQM